MPCSGGPERSEGWAAGPQARTRRGRKRSEAQFRGTANTAAKARAGREDATAGMPSSPPRRRPKALAGLMTNLGSTWPRPACSMNQVHSFRISIRVVHQHPYGAVPLRTERVSRQVTPGRLPDLPGVDAEDAHVAGEGLAHQPAGVTVVALRDLAGFPDRGGGASNEKGGDESRPQGGAQPGAKAVKRIRNRSQEPEPIRPPLTPIDDPPSYNPPHS
jgi:hypothetical protein